MLRPATPVSALLFAAFGLLMIASLSTPIIKGIPLGSSNGVDYGVFGICKGNDCSAINLGYNTGLLSLPIPWDLQSWLKLTKKQDDLTGDAGLSFDIPEGIRGSLSSILVVHPVAAVFTLAMLVMAIMAHIHKFSHSSKYLLFLFLLVLVDALLCILAFLTDALLFSPHLAFGTYFVLAAAIVVSICAVMSFFMRRTLVGRKSRQKRIDQNAEMSGENYYNREAQKTVTTPARQPTMPVLSGANGGADTLPTFTSYESQKKEDQISDDNIPLTQRSPSNTSPPVMAAVAAYNEPRSNSVPPPAQDQYGNPNGPGDGYGVRRGPSFERMNSNSRGRGGIPPQGYRGRGGGGGFGRGGYNNNYGPPPNRGGYGPPGRGGYGPPRGGYGGPPPRGGMGMMRGGGQRSPPGGYQNAIGPYDRQPSPADGYDAYGRQQNGPYGNTPGGSMPNLGAGGYDTYQSSERSSLPRAESPPPLAGITGPQPVGEVAEMDGTTPAVNNGYGGRFGVGTIRDSDTDVAGMVALQQPPRLGDPRLSDGSGSKYSNNDE
jgi:hypothetical protein